jgi:hypothetical protein
MRDFAQRLSHGFNANGLMDGPSGASPRAHL